MTGIHAGTGRVRGTGARSALTVGVAAVALATVTGCTNNTDAHPPSSSASGLTTPAVPVAPQTVALIEAVRHHFPTITQVSALRDNDLYPDHATGRAVDFMIPNPTSPAGIALGDAVVAFAWTHQQQWRVQYTLWRQTYGDDPTNRIRMEDRGSATANHDDHVHITLAPLTHT